VELSEEDLPQYMPQEYRPMGKPQGDPELIEQAASLLKGAKKPIIIAGNPARYTVESEQLQELAESTGIPVFTVEQARGLLDDNHPLCFGYADGGLNPTARRFREADVVLLLGRRLDHRYRYGGVFSDSAKLIQADPSSAEIGRNRGVAVGIEADLGAVVEQISAACKASSVSKENISEWIETLNQDASAWEAELRSHATGQEPMHPLDVYTGLEQHLNDDSVIVMDGGDYVQWGRSFLKARKPGRHQRLGPLSHLGGAIPYAMAAKLAYPDSNVIAFSGDGAFGFYSMEYDTCIRHNINITTVLGNDHTWGIDNTFQKAYYDRAVATDLRPIRYDKVVGAIGGYAEHVEKPKDVGPAVGRALSSGRPALVDVAIRSGASPFASAVIARRMGG
jgi:acetolactate synthase-1/2/3 large subunit